MSEAVKSIIEVTGKEFAYSTPAAIPQRLLRDNPLDGFRNGACLDLRVRFAMELLTHSQMFPVQIEQINQIPTQGGTSPEKVAGAVSKFALDIATELFAEADARGLIEPFSPMDDHLRNHVKRQVAYQLEIAKEQQKQQDQSVQVAGAVRNAIHRPN